MSEREPDPTAAERCPYPEHAHWGWGEDASGDPDPTNCRVCSPAEPDAGDVEAREFQRLVDRTRDWFPTADGMDDRSAWAREIAAEVAALLADVRREAEAKALREAADILGTGPTMRWLYERESCDWWGDRPVRDWLRDRAARLEADQ